MVIDRLKLVSCDRASRIAGVDSSVIADAMRRYTATHGRIGLAFVVLPNRTRPLIRLSAIDAWLAKLEDDSKYVSFEEDE